MAFALNGRALRWRIGSFQSLSQSFEATVTKDDLCFLPPQVLNVPERRINFLVKSNFQTTKKKHNSLVDKLLPKSINNRQNFALIGEKLKSLREKKRTNFFSKDHLSVFGFRIPICMIRLNDGVGVGVGIGRISELLITCRGEDTDTLVGVDA